MYNILKQKLDDLKISEKNKKWFLGATRIERENIYPLIASIASEAGLTPQSMLDLIEQGAPKTLIDVPIISDGSVQIQIQSELFDQTAYNRADEKLFDRFYVSINPQDQSILLFVREKDEIYKPISLSSNPQQQLAAISSACHAIMLDDGMSLAQWLNNASSKMIQALNSKAHAIFADKSIPSDKKQLSIAEYCANNFSASILQSHKLIILASKIDVDGDKLLTPQAIRILDKSMMPFNIFKHILDIYPAFALQAKKLIDLPMPYATRKGIPCINYLDLDEFVKNGQHPTWDFYLLRYTRDEAEVLKAFIYSIFDADNRGRQLLYIYDNGFSGKSAMINAIASGLGDGLVAALQKDSLNNQFGLAKVWDKRLCTIDDNKNRNIIRSEKMHMMLGGGRGEIEQKGRNSFSAQFNLKIIVAGNVTPEIDTAAIHEISRLILLKPQVNNDILQQIAAKNADGTIRYDSYGKPMLIGDAGFSERLAAELPNFLSTCKLAYNILCPTQSNIILPDSVRDVLYDLDSGDVIQMDAAIAEELVIAPEEHISRKELMDLYYSFAEAYNLKKDNNGYGDFIAHLKKLYPSIHETRGTRPAREKRYTGIGKKKSNPYSIKDDAFSARGW